MTRKGYRLGLCAWMLLACAGAAACKSTAETCQREVSDCLRRCDQRGADPGPPPGAPLEQTQSQCESNCQRCLNDPTPPPASKTTQRPTPTGYEQQP